MSVRIIVGDCRASLRDLADESVHCIITSPPYLGLRSYNTEPVIWSGADGCKHDFGTELIDGHRSTKGTGGSALRDKGSSQAEASRFVVRSAVCIHCGAWRGEHGLEPSLDLWLENEVTIWRELRRVLRKDGCAWLNIGDAYVGGGRGGHQAGAKFHGHSDRGAAEVGKRAPVANLRPKQRMMLPARLALALQADGWFIRDEIIWHKPNPMPSSVADRTTPAHEMIYLLTKSGRYYFDGEAISEPFADSSIIRLTRDTVPDEQGGPKQAMFDEAGLNEMNGTRKPVQILQQKITRRPAGWDTADGSHDTIRHTTRNSFARETKETPGTHGQKPQHRLDRPDVNYGRSGNKERKLGIDRGRPDSHIAGSVPWEGTTRNKRSVWTVATEPFPDAHFATFPAELIEPCILASTSQRGACPTCLAQWVRLMWRNDTLGFYPGCACDGLPALPAYPPRPRRKEFADQSAFDTAMEAWEDECLPVAEARRGLCDEARRLVLGQPVVLDPFGGSGTTGLVAHRRQRQAVLLELNPAFAEMARVRIAEDGGFLAHVTVEGIDPDEIPHFLRRKKEAAPEGAAVQEETPREGQTSISTDSG